MNKKNCQVVSVINFKGGVGKTTVTFNLGSELANLGHKVLIVDFDAQGNLSRISNLEKIDSTLTDALYSIMGNDVQIERDPIYRIRENFDIIPCNVMKEKWLIDIQTTISRETVLKRFLDGIKEKYDYDFILIDNAPSINIDLQNSLVASDRFLVVAEADLVSTDGISNVFNVVEAIQNCLNNELKSAGLLINKFEKRTTLHSMMKTNYEYLWDGEIYIYENVIPKSIDAASSQAAGVSIREYKKDSKIAEAYKAFAKEFLKVVESEGK